MLFETNKNDSYNLNLDYFNLNKIDISNSFDKQDNLNLENGFYLGNIYSDLYKPYKNYKPKKVNAYSEQQKMLLKLQELDFIINDLNLYLDVYPNDMKHFELFKKYTKEYDNLKQNYYDRYQVLELCKDNKNKYTWIDNPWPWDGGYYV